MKLIIASNNQHKIVEIRAILGDRFDEILSLSEAGIVHETVEDGMTFMENAVKKAREIVECSGCCALADDSGLCVDALDGAPGVYSARFCGRHGDDAGNNRLLLEKLKGVTERSAHFTCAVALIRPDGSSICAEGRFCGEIAYHASGSNGFGYDPLFYLPEYGCTAAELPSEKKNEISHRGAALRDLVKQLDAEQ